MTDRESLIHFVGGAAGGTAGTALTCPLEVVKTRLQSSSHGFDQPTTTTTDPGVGSSGRVKGGGGGKQPPSSFPTTGQTQTQTRSYSTASNVIRRLTSPRNNPNFLLPNNHSLILRALPSYRSLRLAHTSTKDAARSGNKFAIVKYIGDIIRYEGIGALYKGLVPNLIGVAPSKAVYFYTYSTSKRFLNTSDFFIPNSAIIHMTSAGAAGFVTATCINPVWLVKTRMQLDHGSLSVGDCIRRVYRVEGIRGFYKGVTASYMGISETMIQFVLYEHLRNIVDNMNFDHDNTKFLNFMVAGAVAKFIAVVSAYPHEVVRTRLREEGSKTKGFFETLLTLYREGGYRQLYRGLSVQLIRSVPNTAITMGTYEVVVSVLHKYVL